MKPNLTIPDLSQYNEEVLFLVVSNHKYGDRVLVQIGIKVIDLWVATMTKREMQQTGKIWNQAHLSTTVSKKYCESP